MPALVALWAFAQSPAGGALLLSAAAYLWRRATSGDTWGRRVETLVREAFDAAEAIGLERALPGAKKYVEAARLFSDAVVAEKGRVPTARELATLRAAAERAAWVQKLGRLAAAPVH